MPGDLSGVFAGDACGEGGVAVFAGERLDGDPGRRCEQQADGDGHVQAA